MLKKLKSIFIIEEEEKNATHAKKEKEAPSAKASTPAKDKRVTEALKANGNTIDKSGAGEKPNDKFIDLLLKAIDNQNIEGFDYLEYKQSLQSLKTLETDESKRYRNAFAMAQTMGLDKTKLQKSAQRYLQVLAEEEQKFAAAFQKQRSTQIHGREKKIKDLNASITAKQEQIKQLQKEIKAAQQQLDGIEDEIRESLTKIETTKDGFYASYNMVENQIKTDLQNIEKYIT